MGLNDTQCLQYSSSTNVNYMTAYKILMVLYGLQNHNHIPKQSYTKAFEDSKLVIPVPTIYSILLPGTAQKFMQRGAVTQPGPHNHLATQRLFNSLCWCEILAIRPRTPEDLCQTFLPPRLVSSGPNPNKTFSSFTVQNQHHFVTKLRPTHIYSSFKTTICRELY